MAVIPSNKGLRPSLHGHLIGLGDENNLIIDNRIAVVNPFNQFQRRVLEDHFTGDALDVQWTPLNGSDAQAVDPAVATGICTFTGGNANTDFATDGCQLTRSVMWTAASGDLCFEAVVALPVITTIAAFVGFTDIATLEFPIQSAGSADTFTTNASDAVGFMFDTRMTTDNWWATGVKGDTDATEVNTTVAPVAATYQRLRIELNVGGDAKFYIDGNLRASVDDAVTAATALTPTIAVWPLTTTALTLLCKGVHVSMDR